MRKVLLCALLLLFLTACGHDFAGQTYRVEGGRQVSEVFGRGTAAWKASAEFRFGKCQSCHGVIPVMVDEPDKYALHAIIKEMPR